MNHFTNFIKSIQVQSIVKSSTKFVHGTCINLDLKRDAAFGISQQEYKDRQSNLIALAKKDYPKVNQHCFVFSGNRRRFMVNRIPYRFRQETNMLYLCGCLESDCVLVLHTLPGSEYFKSVMFTPAANPEQEVWDGPRTPVSTAPQVWPVDEALPHSQFNGYVSSVAKEKSSKLWYNHEYFDHFDSPVIPDIAEYIVSEFSSRGIQSPTVLVQRLRRQKTAIEVELMKRTCQISADGIKSCIAKTTNPVQELHLGAYFEYECHLKGAQYMSFPPVVAGGDRANTIHYIDRTCPVFDGELILMDAGSEIEGYCGDVARAWPVNGKFSPAQRDVYEAVLQVQMSVIDACRSRPSIDQLYSLMLNKLAAALKELCILPRTLSRTQLTAATLEFCPHHVSHYLGLDVHDTHLIPKRENIPVGSVITVEPGIYVRENNQKVDSRYRGIGLRIEDDVLVTDSGVEVLSEGCPKEPDAIESLVGSECAH